MAWVRDGYLGNLLGKGKREAQNSFYQKKLVSENTAQLFTSSFTQQLFYF
jgi:hypothetical protein